MTAFPTSSVSPFGDYVNSRLPIYNRKDKLKFEAQLQNYALSLMTSQGKPETEKNLGAGEPVTDRVDLEDDDTGGYIQPGQDRSLTRSAVMTTISAGPRYVEHSGYWVQAEVKITGDAKNRVKNLRDRFVKRPRASHFNFLEKALWAKPHADMEVIGKLKGPLTSIPVIISEEVAGAVSGLTTVHQASPSTKARWRPRRITYDSGNWTDPLTGLRAAFQKMAGTLNFAPIAQGASMGFESTESNYRFIATNLDGLNMYAAMLTSLNQMMPKAQDPAYTGPAFFGHAVVYIPTLDTALLDSQAATAYSQAWPTGKPRFYWIDPEYLYLKYDPDEFLHMTPVEKGSAEGKPDVEMFYVRTRACLFSHSRSSLGVIVPKLASE